MARDGGATIASGSFRTCRARPVLRQSRRRAGAPRRTSCATGGAPARSARRAPAAVVAEPVAALVYFAVMRFVRPALLLVHRRPPVPAARGTRSRRRRSTPRCSATSAGAASGPANTGGRIDDFAVARVPGQPDAIYVATASGGVFKSTNQGTSWTPVFDRVDAMMSIGDIAVAPSNPNVVWVGTGEANNRQSSSWGDGVYKSIDAGRTWTRVGPRATRATSAASSFTRRTRTSSTSRRPDTCGDRTASAACSRPPTAGDVEEGALRRRQHRRDRPRDGSAGSADAVRRDVSAAAQGVGLQRRRTGQRHLPQPRRRRDLDAAVERPAAGRQGAHRPRHLSRRPARRLRGRRGRRARERRLPQRGRRRHVGGVVHAQPAADVLQPDPRRSEGSQRASTCSGRIAASTSPTTAARRSRTSSARSTPRITRCGSIPTTRIT